MLDALIGIIL